MSKFHINPETGVPRKCTATKQCRFGGSAAHYGSEEEARQAFEVTQEALQSFSKSEHAQSIAHEHMNTRKLAMAALEASNYARDLRKHPNSFVRSVRAQEAETYQELSTRIKTDPDSITRADVLALKRAVDGMARDLQNSNNSFIRLNSKDQVMKLQEQSLFYAQIAEETKD